MALARIITRSQACSRELALDLLARGYAVEIVSPDRIPDNLADLELRVDAGPGDQLIANVKTNDGERSASLDFVHHLKAPMGDFIRKPPQPAATIPAAIIPAATIPAATIEDSFILKAEATNGTAALIEPSRSGMQGVPRSSGVPVSVAEVQQRASSAASRSILHRASAPSRTAPLPAKVVRISRSQPIYSVIASTIFQPRLIAQTKEHLRRLSIVTVWRPALTLGAIVLLAASLWVGIRSSGKLSTKASRAATPQKISADVAKNPPAGSPNPIPVISPSADASPSAQKSSPRHSDGNYVAPDTVIYFDKQAAAEAASRATQKPSLSNRRNSAASRQNSGAVAANSITYFDRDGTPKAVTPDSDTKPVAPRN